MDRTVSCGLSSFIERAANLTGAVPPAAAPRFLDRVREGALSSGPPACIPVWLESGMQFGDYD